MSRQLSTLAVIPYLLVILALGGDKPPSKAKQPGVGKIQTLSVVDELTVKSEMARMFIDPIKCDSDENIYLMTSPDPSEDIRKFSSKGELLAHFIATSGSDLAIQLVHYYSIGEGGEVYQVAFQKQSIKRAVLTFDKDGTYKSGAVLENPPGARDWHPSQIAAFPSGDLLATGLVLDYEKRITTPFTGIFASNGQLRKQVALSDDEDIQKMVEGGDPHVVAADHPYSNRAVEFGQMDAASDGNIYLLRNLSPAIIYAISPSGEVVRRFTVDTGGQTASMHISGSRIALLYREGDTSKYIIKVVDTEGRLLATYQQSITDQLGFALACYAAGSERFTFVGMSDEGFLQLKFAEPR